MSQKPSRYIDPLTDWSFKFLFGSEPNREILIDFLNELFAGQKHITEIVYGPNEHGADQPENKKAVVDLYCTGDKGERFIIEMQRGKQDFFRERSVYYTSRLINEQVPKGAEGNTYKLPEVYLIAVLEFRMDSDPSEQYLHDVCLMDKNSHEIFYNKLGYKFLELPNFVKGVEELETDLDRWFYLLKNMSRIEQIPKYFDKRVFAKVFQIAEISKLTKEERMSYETSLQEKWDYENVLDYAVKEGIEKGLQEGIEKGLQEGIEKGILEGKQQTAREMKKLGVELSIISKATQLSLSEIEKL